MENSTTNKKRMLIVEDEPAISDLCRRILTAEGYEVDIAANGRAAQSMIRKKWYDLYLVDIRTPAMNGKEFYQWLKEKHRQVVRRVIFTTGDVLGGDTEAFLKQSGRLFLPKPFTTDELRNIISEALKLFEE